jgi:hypothetical protein
VGSYPLQLARRAENINFSSTSSAFAAEKIKKKAMSHDGHLDTIF